MKQAGYDHLKHGRLLAALGIESLGHWASVGIVESIWKFTARHAPRGDIGRCTPGEISRELGWTMTEPQHLLDCLVQAGWLEQHAEHGHVVHDWADHCEDFVHMRLARALEYFADGTRPKITKGTKKESAQIKRAYDLKEAGSRRDPFPALDPACDQSQSPAPAVGDMQGAAQISGKRGEVQRGEKRVGQNAPRSPSVFDGLTAATLADDAELLAWLERAAGQARPVITRTERDRQRVFCAAERVLEHGTDPVRLFRYIVGQRQWQLITETQDERGRQRLHKHLQHQRYGDRPRARGASDCPRTVRAVLQNDRNQDDEPATEHGRRASAEHRAVDEAAREGSSEERETTLVDPDYLSDQARIFFEDFLSRRSRRDQGQQEKRG